MKKCKTLYVDPPWNEAGGGKIKRGADRYYNLMKTKEIIAMADKINDLVDDNCHLYLWVTNNFLEDGLKVMKEWGFTYKTTITWVKDRIGLGQYFRGMSEQCLFGTRGKTPYKIIGGKRQQGQTAFMAPKSKHSQKPEEMRKMIETVSYPPYYELFARNKVNNWDSEGRQVDSKWQIGQM